MMGMIVNVGFPDHPQVPPMRRDVGWVNSATLFDHLAKHGVDVCSTTTMPGGIRYMTEDGIEHKATIGKEYDSEA